MRLENNILYGSKSVQLPENDWTHIAVTFSESGKSEQYRNGELINSAVEFHRKSLNGNYVLGYDKGYSSYFDGALDNFRIYNRALSEAEVAALYELEKSSGGTGDPGQEPQPDSKPQVAWTFDSGSEIWRRASLSSTGVIYFTSLSGKLYAIDNGGEKIWEFQGEGGEAYCPPTIDSDGTIYFGTKSGQ